MLCNAEDIKQKDVGELRLACSMLLNECEKKDRIIEKYQAAFAQLEGLNYQAVGKLYNTEV